MCDFSDKLMAWLDHELPADDAADVELHLQLCPECHSRLQAYRQVGSVFDGYCDAYCEAVAALRPRHKLSRRSLTTSVAVAAALAALLLLAPRARVLTPVRTPAPVTGAATVTQPTAPAQAEQALPAPAAVKTPVRRERSKMGEIRRAASQSQGQEANWAPPGPAVEIAIPADAIFPPGAVPEGVSFAADVTIAPDGSAQQIRLRPQLAEFERRSTRP